MTREDVDKRFEQIRSSKKLRLDRINRRMDMQLEDFAEDTGDLWVSFEVKDWMLNPGDVMHGGIITTAFDMAMGLHTLLFEREKTIVTINLNIQFIRQIPPGAKLTIHSKILRNGKRLVNLTAQGYTESSDKPAAVAQCEFMKIEDSGEGRAKI